MAERNIQGGGKTLKPANAAKKEIYQVAYQSAGTGTKSAIVKRIILKEFWQNAIGKS